MFEGVANQLRRPSGLVGMLVTSRVLNAANARVNARALELLGLEPDDRVIEVGFGGGGLIGRMAPLVPRGHIAGIDLSPEMVRVCERRFAGQIGEGRIEVRCASAEDLPYDPDRFTKACTVNTVHFWPEPMGALAEMCRVLRVGGTAVVGFSPRATLERVPFTTHAFTHHEGGQIRRLLEDSGFAAARVVTGRSLLGQFLWVVAIK